MYIDFPSRSFMNRGWVCPKCGRVYSILIQQCDVCNQRVEKAEKLSRKRLDNISGENSSGEYMPPRPTVFSEEASKEIK